MKWGRFWSLEVFMCFLLLGYVDTHEKYCLNTPPDERITPKKLDIHGKETPVLLSSHDESQSMLGAQVGYNVAVIHLNEVLGVAAQRTPYVVDSDVREMQLLLGCKYNEADHKPDCDNGTVAITELWPAGLAAEEAIESEHTLQVGVCGEKRTGGHHILRHQQKNDRHGIAAE
eukprot:GDKI01024729.1.p1 GENE.GDKI01024729.1~~GDKI01024729.1.p1  ORF type:complete len:173 (+),score=29.68 GDKI01024729.1:110-628(+)